MVLRRLGLRDSRLRLRLDLPVDPGVDGLDPGLDVVRGGLLLHRLGHRRVLRRDCFFLVRHGGGGARRLRLNLGVGHGVGRRGGLAGTHGVRGHGGGDGG